MQTKVPSDLGSACPGDLPDQPAALTGTVASLSSLPPSAEPAATTLSTS